MLRNCFWFTVMHIAINFSVVVVNAAEDREHVHIKVHIPEGLRKHHHHHYHKVLQKHHHRPQSAKSTHYHRPKKIAPTTTHHITEEYTFLPTPHLPVLPEPEEVIVSDDFESPTVLMSSLYQQQQQRQQGDATTFPQPYGTAADTPPVIHHTTQLPQLKQQLMQQLLTPELMAIAAMKTKGEHFDGDTNSLVPNEFLAELQKEYVKKLREKMQPERLLMHERFSKNKKKYHPDVSSSSNTAAIGSGGYHSRLHKRQQQPQQAAQSWQPEQEYYSPQQYKGNYMRNHNHNYEDDMPPTTQQQQQQYHKLQQYYEQQQNNFESTTDEIMDNAAAAAFMQDHYNDDDNLSGEDYAAAAAAGGGTSFQDMYAAFTKPTAMQSPTIVPTRMEQQWRQQQQQQQKQRDQFVLSTQRLTSTPISLPLSSSTDDNAAMVTSLRGSYDKAFNKKRKRRLKPKRTRIIIQ